MPFFSQRQPMTKYWLLTFCHSSALSPADLRQVTDRLERGETPGDQVKAARHPVYKARLQSSDARKGKSGGYRVIYYIKTPEHVILLIMYLKSEQTDISADEIRRLIEEFQAG